MPSTFWSDPGLEPKRQYRWLFSFGEAGGVEEGSLPTYICRKVDKPQFQVTESEHTFLNHKFYYPGRVEWQPLNVTIVDPLDVDSAAVLQTIVEEAGYVLPGRITPETATPGANGLLQTLSKANFAGPRGVLGICTIKQIDSAGDIVETWALNNVWIQNVNFGSLDYTSDDLVEIELTLRYDWAEQFAGKMDR